LEELFDIGNELAAVGKRIIMLARELTKKFRLIGGREIPLAMVEAYQSITSDYALPAPAL
jgi:hypothetical protein